MVKREWFPEGEKAVPFMRGNESHGMIVGGCCREKALPFLIRIRRFTKAARCIPGRRKGGAFSLRRGLGLYPHPYPFTMARKLRRIHALDAADTVAEITAVRYIQFVFKYIRAFV
jgi:hypothetical protein